LNIRALIWNPNGSRLSANNFVGLGGIIEKSSPVFERVFNHDIKILAGNFQSRKIQLTFPKIVKVGVFWCLCNLERLPAIPLQLEKIVYNEYVSQSSTFGERTFNQCPDAPPSRGIVVKGESCVC
jgi:hypothetical protein